MRKIALWGVSALVALSFTGAAMAAEDPMSSVYGNTVVVTDAKGEATKLWIAKDGTYKGETAKGEKFTGKWALKDNNTKYCSTTDLPANAPAGTPAPKESCSEFKGMHKAGDKWEQTDAAGAKIGVEIKAGM
ncbi:MAG: hypothetical protein K8S25_12115 [Alphaproteobacteria bacterium]|nr:hypothetical protein [Alphaproteobacteria bacterium]